jgi:methylated-DNA-[protein]-cysteine S-methyltransferase
MALGSSASSCLRGRLRRRKESAASVAGRGAWQSYAGGRRGVVAAKRYFDGEQIDFSHFRLDLAEQDAFFEKIYAAARRVGWGHTTTYGTLAKEVGAGRRLRAMLVRPWRRNPVPLIIPCHRVLAAGGKVGGFSAPGGSDAKLRMLELEGVRVGPPPSAQQSLGL